MTRQLVITADDLGMDAPTNTEIVRLLTEGSISATTLITMAAGAEDAVRRVHRHEVTVVPRLHVTLSSARELPPWRPLAEDVPSLTDRHGWFPVDAARVERLATPQDVYREMAAQLAWMHAAGIRPTALDSHSGVLYGMRGRSLAATAVRFCADHDLAFRLPRRLHKALGLAVRGLQRRHREAVAAADEAGVRLPETMISCWLPGRLVTTYGQMRRSVLRQVRALPEGTSELVVHPAPERAARHLVPYEGRKRVWELRLLRDPVFWDTLEREGIGVVTEW